MHQRTPISRHIVALLVAVTLAAAACGTDEGDTATEDASTTTSPAETTSTTALVESPGQQVYLHDFSSGECFDERVVAGQGQVESEEVFLVDCGLPHDNEIYLVTEMPDAVSDRFPGNDAVTDFADDACFGGFEDFVGERYVVSTLEVGYLIPTDETWALPDREVVCFVFTRSGDKLEGSAKDTAV